MTADLVNLRRERKRRTRIAADEAGAANRVAYGLSGAAKRLSRANRAAADRHLDGHRLSEEPESAPPPKRD